MNINGIKIIPKYDGDKIVSITVITEEPNITVYHHCKKRNSKFIEKLKNYSVIAVQDKDGNFVGFDIKTKNPHERFVCKKILPNRNWVRLVPTKYSDKYNA